MLAAAVSLAIMLPIGIYYGQPAATIAAATPDPLLITTPTSGPPPVTLGALAVAARADTTTGDGPVDHLLLDTWDLHTTIAGQSVTSAGTPTRHELWRDDQRALTVDIGPPPATPVHTAYPGGSFPAAFADRPPTDPDQLAVWLARTSTTGTAIIDGITDLLRERVLTGPERAVILSVLADRTTMAYAGTSTDRIGRRATVFALPSRSSGADITHLLLIDPKTGRILATEQIITGGAHRLDVPYPAVAGYRTYLQADLVPAIP
ncbi:hypothetical protein [Actinoplanes couchii]|uniref:Uncharacterized protein n=1 Tax=Actinoplanes couchii TaxID=403638 RepID=A0ABQ3XT09_9ACTN|nr:hypothetical protein [Actinoplanes couchii]MDR6324082.1 hypothetical protein [Actinoplanes couchii]GID61608.1 hypothetical protein Aco03nite_100120 [Actinoplanes couchii]